MQESGTITSVNSKFGYAEAEDSAGNPVHVPKKMYHFWRVGENIKFTRKPPKRAGMNDVATKVEIVQAQRAERVLA